LLLDEPLSALDAPTRTELRRELRRMLRGFATPVVLVTHDPMEAMTLADHVVVMHEGHVRQSGPVDEVFSRPVDPQVARIVGVETVLRGRVTRVAGGVATVAIGNATLAAVAEQLDGDEVDVCIRGEDVIVQRAPEPQTSGGEPSSARNRLTGRVRSVTPDAGLVRVEIECGFPLTALVTRPAAEELRLAEGDAVTAIVKATSVHLIPRGR
jgi:molybdate transport system ATP-binding protein